MDTQGNKKTKKSIIDSNGYVLIKNYKYPHRNNQDYIFEHGVIIEKKSGRCLKKGETVSMFYLIPVVHHVNEIKNDNRIENLKIFINNKEHLLGGKKWKK